MGGGSHKGMPPGLSGVRPRPYASKSSVIELSRPSPDELLLARRGRPAVFARCVGLALGLALAMAWVGFEGPSGFLVAGLAFVGAPLLGVQGARALRRSRHLLVRRAGKLWLDGDALELARVELRLLQRPLLRSPAGYELSLWALSVTGDPLELRLDRFSSMLGAAQVSGQLEEFLERARERPSTLRI